MTCIIKEAPLRQSSTWSPSAHINTLRPFQPNTTGITCRAIQCPHFNDRKFLHLYQQLSMANIVTVAYPHEPGADFDEQYYVQQHMPLCFRSWQRYGLESWSVRKYFPSPEGTDPLYRISCDLVFRDSHSLRESLQSPETAEIIGDVPKFTTTQPIFMYGSAVKSSTE